MNIAVFGIGAVGGYCGARLARYASGRDDLRVNFITRGGMLDAIQTGGLTLQTPDETFTAHPALATADPRDCGPLDLVLLCTKTYHLEGVAQQLAPVVGPQTVILPLLNGIDNAARLRQLLPVTQVISGCFYGRAVVTAPGRVRHIAGPGRILFGAEGAPFTGGAALEELLRAASISAEHTVDILPALWEKFMFIEPFASAGSLTGLALGDLLGTPEPFRLLEGLVIELETLAAAQGVSLPENIHQRAMEKFFAYPPDTTTSMQLDFEKGRPTEVESFSGYVVRAARSAGVPAPLHEQVYTGLKDR